MIRPFPFRAFALALALGLGVYSAATAAAAQDPAAAETRRLQKECKGGKGSAAACVGYADRLHDGTGVKKADPAGAAKFLRGLCEKGGVGPACGRAAERLRPSDPALARTLYGLGCSKSDYPSCLAAGYMRRDGVGGPVDMEMARQGFSLACAGKSGVGCFEQGRIYAEGLGGYRKHLGNAINSFAAGCAWKHYDSCLRVGDMTLAGQGVTADAARAIKTYQDACNAGFAPACQKLDAVRRGGRGSAGAAELAARDDAARAFPSTLPKEQRFILASGALKRGDTKLALTALQVLAEEGMADAAFSLGQLYYHGEGVPKDLPRAVRYFERAADGGHPYAKFVMAHFYHNGMVVKHNPIWAIALMRSAAESGIQEADPIWRAWQNDRDAYFDEQQRQMREIARANEESARAAEAANMRRIWGLYAQRQAQQDGGRVCGMVYRSGQANWECMSRDTYDRYYNPAYR